jgi:hypothetical protein
MINEPTSSITDDQVTEDIVEKAQACAAVKGQRLHATGSLQALQGTRLQIFTNKMDGHQFIFSRCNERS